MWIKRRKILFVFLVIATLFAAGAGTGTGIAGQKEAPREKRVAIGEAEAKKLLLLMDKDENGKVSRQEFMSFMEAEFERLDKNKDGELDVKELTQSPLRVNQGLNRR